ncbi:MAG: sugar phosphate isomerase/epimerase [Lachnospiraceae bacterium]|nr:sugar phosphate isomerase/epimerase [Lachnospiraceae bacterium]
MYKTLAPDCIGHPVTLDVSAPVAQAYGFQGIWLKLERDAQMPVEQTKELLEKYQLRAAGFGLTVDYRKDQETYERGMEDWEAYVRYAKSCGATRCISWIIPSSETLSYEENFRLHVKRLRPIAEVLENYGISFGLEFLGPPKLRKNVKYQFIHNLDGMLELCEAIGTGNMGILLDVWHWDLAGQCYKDFQKLGHEKKVVAAHIMDAPAGIPPEEQEDRVRALPGSTGVLRIGEFFQGLRELGYTGPILAEPFEKRLGDMSFEDAVHTVSESIDAVWPG